MNATDNQVDNDIENSEESDINSEPEDSPLKEIYEGQTFTTFEVLEQSLKRYAIQLGFEIRTVRAEKDGGTWSRKTYKCHHGGKYIPKKKVDPTQN
jgi:hypothetical protein